MNSLFFEIHTREELSHAQTLQRLIHEIVNVGYVLIAESENSAAFTAWWGILNPDWHGWRNLSTEKARDLAQEQASAPELARSMTAGVSPQLQVEIERFCTHGLDKLAVNAYAIHRDGPMRGFEFTLGWQPQGPSLDATFDEQFFHKVDHQEAIEAFEHWLGITKVIYNLWHPIYAYTFNHNGIIPPTPREEIDAFKPEWLYEINLFGPEMVQKLGGRAYVLATPAQIVRPLDDGGVLLIPEMNLYPGGLEFTWETAAEYLGLTCPDFS
ncbi:MAG: hypothetical protein M3Y81_18730 [Chloroflexota bacterium]|nr:hypothetical protein [Chloroflexota bacterium]